MEEFSESKNSSGSSTTTKSSSATTKSAVRIQLVGNIEQSALILGTITGALRAVLADVVNAVKNSVRVFTDAHRKAYSQKHLVRRKL
jgi:hypothetical protein